MARRKEAFRSKVFQKLYPAAPTLEKELTPPRIVEALAKKTYVKRKASPDDTATGDAGKKQSAPNPGTRMYTVLPPPADFETEESVTLPQPEGDINTTKEPAGESAHDSDEELDRGKADGEQQRKRRRRKKKALLQNDGESSTGQSQTAVDDAGEPISRNKKRKLKKKRHKDKLLSMGLVPRATALEFTYQRHGDQEEEEEEDSDMRAADVSDFLRKTMEIYMADSSLHVNKRPLLRETVNDLMSNIANGSKPTAVLKQLHRLKAFVQQKETGKLEEALEELSSTSSMSAEETTAVVSLFQYWIKDILPMQGDERKGLSTMHPRDCQLH